MKTFYRFFLLFLCMGSLVACDFTEKVVGKAQSQSIGGGEGIVNIPLRLKITSPLPDDEGKVGDSPMLLEGTCKSEEGFVFVDGDVIGAEIKTACNDDDTFSVEVQPTKPYQSNTVLVRQSDGSGISKDQIDFDLFVRSPFCGDGEVNQDFEVCDGGLGCSEFCQFGDEFPEDLVLARLTVSNFNNSGAGKVSNDVHLGESETSIPSGVWFVLSEGGFDFVDEDAATFASEAPGVAVSRANGSVKVLLRGQLASGFENIEGTFEIKGAGVDDLDDGVGIESLESFFNGVAQVNPDEDELGFSDGKIQFMMTVDDDDDAFIVDWF